MTPNPTQPETTPASETAEALPSIEPSDSSQPETLPETLPVGTRLVDGTATVAPVELSVSLRLGDRYYVATGVHMFGAGRVDWPHWRTPQPAGAKGDDRPSWSDRDGLLDRAKAAETRASTAERALAEKEAELATLKRAIDDHIGCDEGSILDPSVASHVYRVGACAQALLDTRAELAAVKGEMDALDGRRREGRQLLRRFVKYAQEDRATTKGSTRLARLTEQVADYLERTADPNDILRAPPAVETPGSTVSFPALPTDPEDERIVDALVARRTGGARPIPPPVPEAVGAKLCGIPARSLPPCDMPWGHEGDQHGNGGDGFHARDFDDEHHRRQLVRKGLASTSVPAPEVHLVSFPALPTDAEDERIVDGLVAKVTEGQAVRRMVAEVPAEARGFLSLEDRIRGKRQVDELLAAGVISPETAKQLEPTFPDTHSAESTTKAGYAGKPELWVVEIDELDEDGEPLNEWFVPNCDGIDGEGCAFSTREKADAHAALATHDVSGYRWRVVRYVPESHHPVITSSPAEPPSTPKPGSTDNCSACWEARLGAATCACGADYRREPKAGDEDGAIAMFDEWQRRGLEPGERPERADDWPDEVAFYRRHLEKAHSEGAASRDGEVTSLTKRLDIYRRAERETERDRDHWERRAKEAESERDRFRSECRHLADLDTEGQTDAELVAAVELEINAEYERAETAEHALAEKDAELEAMRASRIKLVQAATLDLNDAAERYRKAEAELAGVKAEREKAHASIVRINKWLRLLAEAGDGSAKAAYGELQRAEFYTMATPPAVETPGATVTFPALPTDPEDERIVDGLVAKATEGQRVTRMGAEGPAETRGEAPCGFDGCQEPVPVFGDKCAKHAAESTAKAGDWSLAPCPECGRAVTLSTPRNPTGNICPGCGADTEAPPVPDVVGATDSELIREAEALGIDVVAHLCGCEVCAHTSQLCPATRSSLALEIEQERTEQRVVEVVGAKCPECRDGFVEVPAPRSIAGHKLEQCSVCHGTGQSKPLTGPVHSAKLTNENPTDEEVASRADEAIEETGIHVSFTCDRGPGVSDADWAAVSARVAELATGLSRSASPEAQGAGEREAAIMALVDFAEQPHPGRAGEAIDALERHLRASQPATETTMFLRGDQPAPPWLPMATRNAIAMGGVKKHAPQPVEGVSDYTDEHTVRCILQELWYQLSRDTKGKLLGLASASRSSAAKDARIAELERALREIATWAEGKSTFLPAATTSAETLAALGKRIRCELGEEEDARRIREEPAK